MNTPATTNNGAPADVTVIGAGIVGLACALRLGDAGFGVTVIDRQAPGRGCSYGNAGHVATQAIQPLSNPDTLRHALGHLLRRDGPLRIHPRYALRSLPWLTRFALAARHHEHGRRALLSLQQHSLDALKRLLRDAGGEKLLRDRGHLLVTESAAGFAEFKARQKAFQSAGIACRIMSASEALQLAPALANSVRGALYFADTAHIVDPYKACRVLADAVLQRGGRLVRGDVKTIRPREGGRFELSGDNVSCETGRVLVAAGAWAKPLARQLGEKVPLDTERGYHLSVEESGIELSVPVSSVERHTIVTPMSSCLRITGFLELGGLELPPRPLFAESLQRHLRELLPGITTSRVKEWMGHRPSLPDHLPVIGAARRFDNAWFAFGHQHLGLTLAGITADCIAAVASGQEPPVDLWPFRPERFS